MTGINPDGSLLWLRQLNDAKQGDMEAMGAILQAFWQSLVKDAWRRHGTSQKREVGREIGAVHEAEHKNLEETFAVRSIDVAIAQERKSKLLSILSQMPAHFP